MQTTTHPLTIPKLQVVTKALQAVKEVAGYYGQKCQEAWSLEGELDELRDANYFLTLTNEALLGDHHELKTKIRKGEPPLHLATAAPVGVPAHQDAHLLPWLPPCSPAPWWKETQP